MRLVICIWKPGSCYFCFNSVRFASILVLICIKSRRYQDMLKKYCRTTKKDNLVAQFSLKSDKQDKETIIYINKQTTKDKQHRPYQTTGINSGKQVLFHKWHHRIIHDVLSSICCKQCKRTDRGYDSANRPQAICQICRWTIRIVIYKFKMVTVTLIKLSNLLYYSGFLK